MNRGNFDKVVHVSLGNSDEESGEETDTCNNVDDDLADTSLKCPAEAGKVLLVVFASTMLDV